MKFINKLLSSVLSILMVTTCLNVGVVADDGDTAKESEQTDYSSLIKNELSYSEDKSTATLVISIDTEDGVHLDIADDDSFQELYDEGKLAVNEEQTSSKSLAYNIAANGDYTFVVEVYDSNNQKLASKEVAASVTELTETGGVDTEYKTQEATAVTVNVDATIDDSDAQVVKYYYWSTISTSSTTTNIPDNLSESDFKTINSTSNFNLTDFSDTSKNSYILFFVKPNDGYLFTGVGASGKGQYWVVGSDVYKEDDGSGIAGYPDLDKVMEVAKNAGYKAVFGYTRLAGDKKEIKFEINTKKPTLDVDAIVTSSTPKDGYAVGSSVTFGITLTPSSIAEDANYDIKTYTDDDGNTKHKISITGATINGVKVEDGDIGDLVEDPTTGEFRTTIKHVITDVDAEAKKIALEVDASITYTITIDATVSGQQLTTDAEVNESGTVTLRPMSSLQVGNLDSVTYDGNSHKLSPEVIDDTKPEGEQTLKENTDYTVSYAIKKSDGTTTKLDPDTGDFTNVKTIVVTITGMGEYDGTITREYTINKRPVTFTGESGTKTYTGETFNLTGITVSTGTDQGLVSGHTHNVTASATGTAVQAEAYAGTITDKDKVVIKSGDTNVTGNYDITTTAGSLTITGQSINKDDDSYKGVTVEKPSDTVYNGSSQQLKPTVKDKDGKSLTEGTDYELEYSSDTTSAGKVTVTVKGKGNYSGTVNTEYTINKRPVTFTGESGTKTYTGETFNLTGITVSTGTDQGLVSGHTHNVTASATGTAVQAEAYAGTITDKDKVVIKSGDTNVTGNYDITTTAGSLTITKANTLTISSGLENDKAEKVYDGFPLTTTPSASVTEGTTIQYSTDNGQTWADIAPSRTNQGTTTVIAKATNPNYEDATVTYTLKVTKRPIEVVGDSDSKEYNGQKQEVTTYSVNTKDGKLDVVSGQTLTAVYSANGTDANEDSGYTGIFDSVTVKDASDNDVTDNYEITKTPGVLKITPKKLDPGTAGSSITVDKAKDVTYDGQSHKWEPTVKYNNTKLTEETDYTVTYTVKDSKGKDVTTTDFTNVNGYITVTVTGKGNYTGSFDRVYQITPKALKITTNSSSKVYDGKALTAEGTIEGIVDGETYTFNTTGSQLHKGESDNGYELKFDGTAKESNYSIVEDDVTIGTLKVTAQSVDPKDDDGTDDSPYKGIKVTPPADTTYNGKNQELKPTVTDSNGKVLEEGKDYTIKYSDDTKNAGTVTVEITGIGDYSGTVETSYKINKVDVTITTGGGEKTYDGSPLTNSDVKITGDIVDGEIIKITATGSQTEVGESDNTYEITWGDDVNKDNYNIIPSYGKLVVKKKDEPSSKVVTCEEYMHSKDWTWSETKKACVYKVSNTSSK